MRYSRSCTRAVSGLALLLAVAPSAHAQLLYIGPDVGFAYLVPWAPLLILASAFFLLTATITIGFDAAVVRPLRAAYAWARKHRSANILVLAALFLCLAPSAHAQLLYIGPGAGFAFLSSFLVLIGTFFLAIGTILMWPIRVLWRLIFRSKALKNAQVDRVVIVGLDGMDPKLAQRFMAAGKMPNFSQLASEGSFQPLETSFPSISPVAWSSFMTGVDASRHNIFDFLTRDPCTYMPMLSSTDIGQVKKVLPLGKYLIPLGKPTMRLLRKSQPFWKLLGEHHIFSSILRVPITFPPEKFNGVLLSGMCVPDLKGTQGTFSFYSTRKDKGAHTGGVQIAVERKGNVVDSYLEGPENSMRVDHPVLKLPFKVTIDDAKQQATLHVGDEKITLKPREYSPWVQLKFKAGLGITVHGIARFYIMSLQPEFELYVTPLQIDPENPAMPISHPFIYSIYLAKMQGPFATLGLAEDTWALNERVIDEDAFLKQTYLIQEEREKMLMNAIEHTKKGLVTCVFDTTDRIQHMFYRYLDPTHPANVGKDTEQYKDTLEDLYQRMDRMLGRIRAKLGNDKKTLFCVISDHGFTQFKRGVNLNAWLRDQGLLHLKDGKQTGGDWFDSVDWSRTKAFALGLTGLFINRKGREAKGIVSEGAELAQVRKQIKDGLLKLRDPKDDGLVVLNVFETDEVFDGPYKLEAPDLLIGYNHGFRNSWDCATGAVSKDVFSDNTKSWSGDHCVDPRIVPGVLFSTRKVDLERPHLMDMAPTVLKLFGVPVPGYMKGRSIFEKAARPPVEVKVPEKVRA